MSVILLRIDDRLVHGQVVEGWLRSIRATMIVVASDSVAADETQKALYYLAVPQGIKLECLSVKDVARFWSSDEWNKENVLVLVSSPQEALALVQAGAVLESINVGGMHYNEKRIQILKAVSLNDNDIVTLRAISDRGIALEARPLPLDEPVDVVPFLERWQNMSEQPR
jgi:mannose/fructose/N-acetylgalactosamine-specific phosphotransferase system component IIB